MLVDEAFVSSPPNPPTSSVASEGEQSPLQHLPDVKEPFAESQAQSYENQEASP